VHHQSLRAQCVDHRACVAALGFLQGEAGRGAIAVAQPHAAIVGDPGGEAGLSKAPVLAIDHALDAATRHRAHFLRLCGIGGTANECAGDRMAAVALQRGGDAQGALFVHP
jgi:hypothetical protein